MNTETTQTIDSLSDLTGNPKYKNRPLPQLWIDILEQTFPDIEKRTILPSPQAGKLAILLPKTTLVLRVKPFVWATIKALANLWLTWQLHKTGNQAASIFAGISVVDAFRDIITSLVQLDENSGEMCTYAALIGCGDAIKVGIGIYPQQQELISHHQQTRSHCQVVTCHYYQQTCQITEKELLSIIKKLIDKKIFVQHTENTLWPTF